jgi:pimeloyl-ACP methyl ester carboxylesterase
VAPDLFGHGRTDFWPDPKTLTHDDQGDLINAVLEEVGATSVHMIAHSYGGASGIRHLLKRPATVRSLVVIEPMIGSLLFERSETQATSEVTQMWDGFLESLEASGPEAAWQGFLDFRNGPGSWDGFPQKTRDNFLSRTEGHVANIHANKSNPTTMAELATIAVPTLAIRSERPTHFDLRMVELVAEAIPGCEFITLPDTEHMCPLTHPDLVAEAIDRHILKKN